MFSWLGGGVSSRDLSIPVERARSRFSGASLIANLLDTPANATANGGAPGHLAEALRSGSARHLAQAIDQLNPSEREALRARWGRSLDELISLSNERDARVFHHGLLQVGRRLEDSDQIDLSGVVYSSLVAEGSNSPHPPLNLRGGEEVVPPLRLRGGQEGLLPSDVANQAQRRLNAINGVGDWRERFAFSLQRIPNQATRWDVLLAMTGAGFTFRGIRLLTTASWAGGFESALALNAASASTAFLAETIAFTSLGKVAGALAGHPQDTSANGIFNEWAGGAAMLLGLKGMGALTGAGVRSIYGEGVAATATGRLTQILAPQAGMFMGILVGNRLAEAGGFHPERHGDTWLVDGITTLIEFNVAGRIQRVAGGPALTSLEARMEALRRSLGHGSARPGETWDGRSKDRPLPGIFESMSEWMKPELVTPEGLRFPVLENRASEIEGPQLVFNVKHEVESGGARGVGDLERLAEMAPRAEGDEHPARETRYRLPDTPYFRELQEKGAIDLRTLAMYAESERWNSDVGSVLQTTLRFPLIGKYMYSPGGAAVVERGRERPELLPQLMGRWQKALVASPSRAILGLGAAAEDGDFTIRAEQGIPIMRGKSTYFFTTAGVTADYQTWRTQFSPQQLRSLRNLDPVARAERAGKWRSEAFARYLQGVANNYGFINIEDEAGEFLPQIFGMLEGLRGQCCVWSDDMMGTGVITAAGMLSWAHLTNRMRGDLSLEGVRGIIFGAGAGSKGVYDELLKHGVRPENILVADSKGVLFEGRGDIRRNPLKVEMSRGIRPGTTVEDFARGADFVINLGSEKTFTKNPAWTRDLIRSLARQPIVLPMTNPEPGLTPEQLREIRFDALYGSGNQEYVNPFNNFVAFGPTALGALTAQAMWMGPRMTVSAARGIFEVAKLGPAENVLPSLSAEQREFGHHWLVPRPDDPRLIHFEAGGVAKAAAREGLSGILGENPPPLLLRLFESEVDRRLDYIVEDLTGQLQRIEREGPEYLRRRHPDRFAPFTLRHEGRDEVVYYIAPRIESSSFFEFAKTLQLDVADLAPALSADLRSVEPRALTSALMRLRPATEAGVPHSEVAYREVKLITQIAAVSPGLGLALALKAGSESRASIPTVFHDPAVLRAVLDLIPEAEGSLRALEGIPQFELPRVLAGKYPFRTPAVDLEALDRPETDPLPLLGALAEDPLLRSLLPLRVGELEPIDLARHTRTVMALDRQFFGDAPSSGGIRLSTLRLLALSHDLGKPLAMISGNKREQHNINPAFVRGLFAHWDVGPEQTRIALALLNSRFGSSVRIFRRIAQLEEAHLAGATDRVEFFEGRIRGEYGLEPDIAEQVIEESRIAPYRSRTFESLARGKIRRSIERGAAEAGMTPGEFLPLAIRFHQIDGGAWTTFSNGGEVQIPGAEKSAFDDLFLFNSEARRITYHPYVQAEVDALGIELASPSFQDRDRSR